MLLTCLPHINCQLKARTLPNWVFDDIQGSFSRDVGLFGRSRNELSASEFRNVEHLRDGGTQLLSSRVVGLEQLHQRGTHHSSEWTLGRCHLNKSNEDLSDFFRPGRIGGG